MPKLSPNKTKFNFVLWFVTKNSTSQQITSINSHLAICPLVKKKSLEFLYEYRPRSQEGYHINWHRWIRGLGVGLGAGLSEVKTSVMAGSGSCAVWTFAFALHLKRSRNILTQVIQLMPDIDHYVLRVVSNILLYCWGPIAFVLCVTYYISWSAKTPCRFPSFLSSSSHLNWVIVTLSLIRLTACARAQFTGCSSTSNAHSETGQMAFCCQNVTLWAPSSRSAFSVMVFLNTLRTDSCLVL